MRIGAISDTHGLLRPQVLRRLEGCDCILHAGDVGGARVLEDLRRIAPVHAVRGNNDVGAWARDLPDELLLTLAGRRVFIAHKRDRAFRACDADAVVCGHSHAFLVETVGGVLYLNPGSCGRRRFNLPLTMALVHLDAEVARVERIDLAP